MAQISVETTGIQQRGTDGYVHEYRLAYDTEETSNIPFVLVHCYTNGVRVGTPIRFKDANGRIAADLPGVDPAKFITEDGHITNG